MALGINVEFAVPLPPAEVAATAQSVARWVWRKLSREGLVVVQTIRGRRRAAQPSAAEARSEGGTRGAATTNGLSSPAVVDGRVRGGQIAGRVRTPAQIEASRRNIVKAQQAVTVKHRAPRDAAREEALRGS